jgi:hypothetical protein
MHALVLICIIIRHLLPIIKTIVTSINSLPEAKPAHSRKIHFKNSTSLKSRLSHIINPHPKKKPYSPTMARSYNNHSFLDYISYFSMPIHLFFFISILFSILCLSWYINYEDKFEDLINQVKLFLMLSPVVLLLLVHCLSSCFPVFLPFPERDSLHRAGGSPWGVALLLVFLIFMISYQSSFHELW